MSLIRRGRISVMCQRHRTLNGTNGYSRRSLFRGLAQSGIGGGGRRPPVVPDRTRFLDIEAAGGVVGQNVEHHGAPTPLLPLDRQIMQEAEVITPPRRGAHGHGGRQAPETQLLPGGTQVVPQIFTDVRTRDVGSDRRNDAWSPGTCWLTRWLGCGRIWQISELQIGC